jgi:hypothetical protein
MSGQISALRQHCIRCRRAREFQKLIVRYHDTITWTGLKELENALTNHKNEAIFACGGKSQVPNTSLFYSDKEGKAHQIAFPASEDDIRALGETCDPATFGLLAEDKLDLDHRSAWKMDNTKFASSFHPADASDILNVVQAILPPEGSMYAELYKLNVPPCVLHVHHRSTKDPTTN